MSPYFSKTLRSASGVVRYVKLSTFKVDIPPTSGGGRPNSLMIQGSAGKRGNFIARENSRDDTFVLNAMKRCSSELVMRIEGNKAAWFKSKYFNINIRYQYPNVLKARFPLFYS